MIVCALAHNRSHCAKSKRNTTNVDSAGSACQKCGYLKPGVPAGGLLKAPEAWRQNGFDPAARCPAGCRNSSSCSGCPSYGPGPSAAGARGGFRGKSPPPVSRGHNKHPPRMAAAHGRARQQWRHTADNDRHTRVRPAAWRGGPRHTAAGCNCVWQRRRSPTSPRGCNHRHHTTGYSRGNGLRHPIAGGSTSCATTRANTAVPGTSDTTDRRRHTHTPPSPHTRTCYRHNTWWGHSHDHRHCGDDYTC